MKASRSKMHARTRRTRKHSAKTGQFNQISHEMLWRCDVSMHRLPTSSMNDTTADYSSAAWAAANRAIGIRNGLQLTYSRPRR
jgi:hypothetical protein